MSRARAAIISGLRSIPGLTVGEIAECDIDLSSITVEELGGNVGFSSTKGPTVLDCMAGTPYQEANPGVLTRLKSDRTTFDRRLCRILLKSGVTTIGAETIASAYKGLHSAKPTPDQLRKSLARSIVAKLVKRTGKARGTRYELTAKGIMRVTA